MHTHRRAVILIAIKVCIDNLPLEIVAVDRRLTFAAAHIRAHHPMSYADAFVVALAQRESAAVVTGDPEFAAIQNVVRVDWLR